MIGKLNPLGLVGTVVKSVTGLASEFITDKDQQVEFQFRLQQQLEANKHELMKSEIDLMRAQVEVNKEDAKSGSNYRGGWRPFVGWVCGFGLFYHFLGQPISQDLYHIFTGQEIELTKLDIKELLSLLVPLLGLGAYRSFEKSRGIR